MINVLMVALGMLTNIEPLPFDQMTNPISLSGECKDVTINEWQNLPFSRKATAVAHINEVCNASIKNIKPFLTSKKISFNALKIKARISLLNYRGFRSMNDNLRFTFGNKVYDDKGNLLPQIGQYHYSTKTIFLDNDIFYDDKSFNIQFARVLSHEIFHAVLKQNDLLNQLPEPTKTYNEMYAIEFEEVVETKRLMELFQ